MNDIQYICICQKQIVNHESFITKQKVEIYANVPTHLTGISFECSIIRKEFTLKYFSNGLLTYIWYENTVDLDYKTIRWTMLHFKGLMDCQYWNESYQLAIPKYHTLHHPVFKYIYTFLHSEHIWSKLNMLCFLFIVFQVHCVLCVPLHNKTQIIIIVIIVMFYYVPYFHSTPFPFQKFLLNKYIFRCICL